MKKLCLTLCIALSSITSINSFAQNKLKWEGQIGMNISKFTGGYDSQIGYHIGARAKTEIPSLANGIYANAGAFLTLKGASFDFGDLGNSRTNMNYLEIPIHIGYQYAINDQFTVFGEFGPYFAVGLFGKTKGEELDYNDYFDEITTSYSYNTFDDFKRFDFGLGLRFGIEFKQKYTLSIGYDFGLIDNWKQTESNDTETDITGEEIDLTGSLKNRNLTIGIGYKF